MQQTNDMELLREFARHNSEAAFTELVRRHVNLVYSVGLRCTGNESDAGDVAQAVFIILARKAAAIREGTLLTGWLYEATRFTAARLRRTNARRRQREQEAYLQSKLNETDTSDVWRQLAPHLEVAMSKLTERDRALLVLRFYENKSGPEAAALLGIREDTAHKRAARAIEKLRKFFSKRGIALSGVAIAGAVSANSVQAASAGMAETIFAVASAKGATTTTSTLTLVKGVLRIMAWSKAKVAVATAVILVCIGGGGAGISAYRTYHSGPYGELWAALHIPATQAGVRGYPSDKVTFAIIHLGTNRANAFPILKKATKDPHPEVRKQAAAALQMVGIPGRPKSGLPGEPSREAAPLLWEILNGDDRELSSIALTSLEGIGFEPKDFPVLAALLVRSGGGQLSQKAMANVSLAQMQLLIDRAAGDQQMESAIPGVIAATIHQNPGAAAPLISSVEELLDDASPDVRFGAACALGEYKGVADSKISRELSAGLKSRHNTSRQYPDREGQKQLVAIETLQQIGPAAKPMIPELRNYAESIENSFMRDAALKAIGTINGDSPSAASEANPSPQK